MAHAASCLRAFRFGDPRFNTSGGGDAATAVACAACFAAAAIAHPITRPSPWRG